MLIDHEARIVCVWTGVLLIIYALAACLLPITLVYPLALIVGCWMHGFGFYVMHRSMSEVTL